jgi:anti-anti-sigma factor
MPLEIRTAIEITLSGDLDAASAPEFERALEAAAMSKPMVLVLRFRDLAYLSSRGVRALLYAKQRLMPPRSVIYVIAPPEGVRAVLEQTRLHQGLIIQEEYPGAA